MDFNNGYYFEKGFKVGKFFFFFVINIVVEVLNKLFMKVIVYGY